MMRSASPRRFFKKDEIARVVAAIRDAEEKTSGEIRVHMERHCKVDPLRRARALFAELGMEATARRSGVLLYIAIADRVFAIYGDSGIHSAVGDAYWEEIRDGLAEDFGRGAFCDGVCRAVASIGRVLAASFPIEATDVNELRDEPTFGE